MPGVVTRTLAAGALGAVGFAESAMVFAWPLWASLALAAGAAWAGVVAFAPPQPKPIKKPRDREG